MSLRSSLDRLFEAGMDARTVALVRIIVGCAALIRGLEARRIIGYVFAPDSLRLPYAPGPPPFAPGALPAFIVVWCGAALCFALGWRTRLAGSVLAAVMGYSLVLDQQTYSNHGYLLTLIVLLLTLADSGARFSLDALRGHGRATVPAWPVELLKLQLTIVYLFSAISKLNVGYLSGGVLAGSLRRDGLLAIPEAWRTAQILAPIAVASIIVEAFIGLALWSPRLRRIAVAIGLLFHGLIVWMLDAEVALQLAVFATAAFALYLPFLDLTPVWRRLERVARPTALNPDP